MGYRLELFCFSCFIFVFSCCSFVWSFVIDLWSMVWLEINNCLFIVDLEVK